jgi:RNA polymerase sigma-70 factor (ECF subfamily)
VHLSELLSRPAPVTGGDAQSRVAVAMAEGPEAGLRLLDGLSRQGYLENYHLFHAARADLLRRTGSAFEAGRSYRRALELVGNDSERRFLIRRLGELE